MDTSELEKLRTDVEHLQRTVDELQANLDTARGRIDLTMRRQMRCPACGGTRILEVRTLMDKCGYGPEVQTLTGKHRVIGRPWKNTTGTVGAFLCGRCGLMEHYVQDVEGVEIDGENIRVVRSGDEDGGNPYR